MGQMPSEIATSLRPAERKGILSREGYGEYSSSTFQKLLDRGLVDRNFRLTDLGVDVRDALRLL